MKQKMISIYLPERYIEDLDVLVKKKMYPSRSAAIRTAVRDLIRKELWLREEKRWVLEEGDE